MGKNTKFSSFEHVTASLETEEGVIFITSLYYPGYSAKHRFTYAAFTSDLNEKLEFEFNRDGKQFIFGDLNIHMEDPSRDETINLTRILDENNYTQLVRETTHNAGGILDLCLTRSEELPVVGNVSVSNDTKSRVYDHFPIILDISTNPCLVPNKK